MILPLRSVYRVVAITGFVLAAASAGLHADPAATSKLATEAPYLAENDAAMMKMMRDMAVKPTGDVDRDFVAMKVPHHQGAIDMAVAVLRYERRSLANKGRRVAGRLGTPLQVQRQP